MIESTPAWQPLPGLPARRRREVVGVNNINGFRALHQLRDGVWHRRTGLHRGRRQQLWLVTITDDTDRVVARGRGCRIPRRGLTR